MTVTAAFCPLSLQPLRDANDARIVGGKIYTYAAGTTNLLTTFADGGLTTPNPNPLLTDGLGRIPEIYIGLGSYKIVAQDASGAQIFVADNLPGGVDYVAQATAAAQAAGAALSGATTGDVKFKHGFTVDAGWVILNGRTIGNGSTQATARANDDTRALFVYLWNCDGSLAVSGGRGVTASSDFTASKTLTLPDYRGRAIVGCDGMGAGSLAGVISVYGADATGIKFGSETVTLTQAQLPAVSPAVTVASATHSHTGSTDSQGSHNHGGNTSTTGAHAHTYLATATNNTIGGSNGSPANESASTASTSTTGDHAHTISADGAHTHTVTLDSGNPGGAHTHTASIAALGSGSSHSNLQPSILGYFHVKL